MEPAEHKAQTSPVNNKSKGSPRGGKRTPKKITETYLHNSGLYYLQRFAAGKAHFKSVMMRKVRRSCQFYPEQSFEECRALVDAVADKFEASGLLNDNIYLQAAATTLHRQGRSAKAIRAKLGSKGFRNEQIEEALKQLSDLHEKTRQELELEAALRFAKRKKIGRFRQRAADVKDINKDLGVLARAGFSYDVSRKVMDGDMDFPDAEGCY